jgi:hypothetical protein
METAGPTNPYEAPRAELNAPAPGPGLPANLENAVAGNYDFTVGEVMDEAWRLTKGMKGTFWGAAIVIGLIHMVVGMIGGVIFVIVAGRAPGQIANQVFNGVINALMTPFQVGLYMMCVRRALGLPISFGTAFSYLNHTGVLLATALLALVMTCLGLALLIVPGIYLGLGYLLANQLVCDQGLSPWKAMETSRRAIHHHWWSVLGLLLLVGLITGASALGLLIPLIWTIPWAAMVTGVLYRRIFYAPAPAAAQQPQPAAPAPAPASASG